MFDVDIAAKCLVISRVIVISRKVLNDTTSTRVGVWKTRIF